MSDLNPAKNSSETAREPSPYQRASQAFYGKMRKSHSGVYSSKARMEEEQSKKRYTNVQPKELESAVQNLGSLITLLRRLCGLGPNVAGIDFGCGSHWFVDYVTNDPAYGWSAVGYDPDACAIELAHQRFPNSAEYYRCLDPIQTDLPEATNTQNFVFSNAVLQHFDDHETDRAISEMSRVLRRGGICMLIFKYWDDELLKSDGGGMTKAPQVLDAAGHQVLFFDPTMKETIDQLPTAERERLDELTREGWRLFHLFPLDQIIQTCNRHGLFVASDITYDNRHHVHGVITYRSGKKMPTACVILRKQ